MNTNKLERFWHFAHLTHSKRPCPFFHPADQGNGVSDRERATERDSWPESFLVRQVDNPCGAVVLNCLIEAGEAEEGDSFFRDAAHSSQRPGGYLRRNALMCVG